MQTVAFVTYSDSPAIAADDQAAVKALEARGIAVVPWVWDDPATQTGAVDAAILRSCWNYHRKPEAFLAWIDSLAARGVPLWNPPDAIRWNVDKKYVFDLARNFIVIPNTRRLARGASPKFDVGAVWPGAKKVVVKPTVSLNGEDTHRVAADDAAALERVLTPLLARCDVLVQEFVAEVEAGGEISLVFIGGAFSHAIRKRPRAGEFRVQVEYGGTRETIEPPPGSVFVAEEVLKVCGFKELLYARVDVIQKAKSFPLIEFEIVDPTLFFAHASEAAERFAIAVAERFTKPELKVSVTGDGTAGITISCTYGRRSLHVSCGYESYGQPHGPEMLIIPLSGFRTWSDGSAVDPALQQEMRSAVASASIPVMYRFA